MTIQNYINNLNSHFKSGISTEHTYRADLQNLISDIAKDVFVTNEPSRIACGAPDYIITKKDIPIGYIEAKDIGADLNNKLYKEQFDRYKSSLNNLIITDYLSFQLFRDGILVSSISIGNIQGNKITSITGNIDAFIALIKEFSSYKGQTITSASGLSKMMAAKARLLADIIEKSLNQSEVNVSDDEIANNTLHDQLNSFKQILIHDITVKGFADIYSQTIAYGMFAARLHDAASDSYTRQKAAELIPKSNPFLRKLFQYIAGYDLDDRIKWLVDALADIFSATDIVELLKDFGKATHQHDPMIHFYETFLSEYDPALRKNRGVWYTPEPVVKFIVRAVDDILKTEFGLQQGLADNSKTKIQVSIATHDKRYMQEGEKGKRDVEQLVHKVQILDPACGTGTFLAEVVRLIHNSFEAQQGIWSNYVEEHLIPRLNGFEILMASYAMAHLKLDLLLSETGYKPLKEQRLRIYLTNSLEKEHKDAGTLFANWLTAEANEANYIKRDTPVMVVLGNPPYSGESSNTGESIDWLKDLLDDYKKEPGSEKKLKEKNPKWINDDYVKFIRYGQYFIEKNGEGILAFINNHSFLDNPTFRGMRWNLLKTFDKLYILDLHGNSKKKEVSPDGSKDENVFDIQQGVSINLFVKTGKKEVNILGKIFHFDLFGKRDLKYDILLKNSISSISYKELPDVAPYFFFVNKDFTLQKKYNIGFQINELFKVNSVGIVTSNDSVLINNHKNDLIINVENHFNIKANNDLIYNISYRPFDNQFIYYDTKIVERARLKIMQHFFKGKNFGLVTSRQCVGDWKYVFVSKNIIEFNLSGIAGRFGSGSLFPLYLYPEKRKSESSTLSFLENTEPYVSSDSDSIRLNKESKIVNLKSNKDDLISMTEEPRFAYQSLSYRPNLSQKIVRALEKSLGMSFVIQQFKSNENEFGEVDILDYIYSVLHSPTYREKYKEFLKIDFPRIPYPIDQQTFWQMVKLGGELRQIHLLESPVVEKYITQYPIGGDNIVIKIKFQDNKVFINETQYFANVPGIAWDFYIGGYQPAQKWLKDRKGRTLGFDDILHYQKIIVVLTETDRIMKEIDKIEIGNYN